MLCQVLEQDLYENSTTRGGLFLIQVDDRQNVPSNGIIADHVPEEPCDIAQAIGLVAMDGVVVLCK